MQEKLYLKNIRRYDTQQRMFVPGSVLTAGEKIVALDEPCPADAAVLDGGGKLLLPGLIDVHTHGRCGYDFDSAEPEEIDRMMHAYALDGTTTAIPTIASAPFEQMLCAVERARMCGAYAVHIEGRYLSPKRRGAHRADLLAEPRTEELKLLLEKAGTMHLHLTVAPELPGGRTFIQEAIAMGASVSMGHTDATWEQAQEAIAWGVGGASHLCNAMPPLHHRQPGAIGAALCEDIYTELICDGMHVHPGMIRLVQKIKNPEKIVLITDSMSATGCPDGRYAIAGLPVNVVNGEARNEEGALAGSTLVLWRGLHNFMRFCGLTLEQALPCATIQPAKMLGLDDRIGSLCPGKDADMLLCCGEQIETVIRRGKVIQ